ncbi:MAG: sigma-70 family RNA polymerase sigma factor [Phycisphaerales bacterium]
MPDASSPPADGPSSSHLTESSHRRIRWHAHRLARRYWLRPEDRADLEQDLTLDVLVALRRYRPELSSPDTFCERVLTLAARYRARQIRSRWRYTQRTEPAVKPDDLSAAGEDHHVARADRSMDLMAALDELPPAMRRFAVELMYHSPREIARRTRAHRATVYRRIARLRTALAPTSPTANS